MAYGPTPITPAEFLSWLEWRLLGMNPTSAVEAQRLAAIDAILLAIRLPRLCVGLLGGASLAVAGVGSQGLFRNPLADPSLIGVTAGAAMGAVTAIAASQAAFMQPLVELMGVFLLPGAAFIGGAFSVWAIYHFAKVEGRTSVVHLLLAGIAINALALAYVGLLITRADYGQLREFQYWTLGSLGAVTPRELLAILPFTAVPLFIFPLLARPLNVLLLGEAEAGHLGIEVQRLKLLVIVLCTAMVGAVVSVTGVIGFVGLVVPHWVRLLLGPDHKTLIPASALVGALLLVSADWLARLLASPAEIPIGIITALVGAPVFLLLMRSRRGTAWS
ncbi:MAG: iron ABC transporter permease [Verrucomicrobiota bacterium]|nr:iron ABC transporter permease [Verrucomicrobiota bacterium]